MEEHSPGLDEALGSIPNRARRRVNKKKKKRQDSNVSPKDERMVLKSAIESPEIGGSLPLALCYDVPGVSAAPTFVIISRRALHIPSVSL